MKMFWSNDPKCVESRGDGGGARAPQTLRRAAKVALAISIAIRRADLGAQVAAAHVAEFVLAVAVRA